MADEKPSGPGDVRLPTISAEELRWKVRRTQNAHRAKMGRPLLPDDPDEEGTLFDDRPEDPTPEDRAWWKD